MSYRLVDLCFGRGAAVLVTPIQACYEPLVSAREVEEVDPWKKEQRKCAMWAHTWAGRGAVARPMRTLNAPKIAHKKRPGARSTPHGVYQKM